ncbi:MAG: hypothetical protein FWC71_06950 [Defluviitaleaceae bacterium]|nr:hypothetical protein [Defluviitaleaceae bacterium]
MSPLKATMKWEAIKWWYFIGKRLWIVVLCWALMFLPVPGVHWETTTAGMAVRWLMLLIVLGAGLAALLCAILLMFGFPLFFVSFSPSLKSAIMERGSGYSVGYQVGVRMLYALATYALSAGMVVVTLFASRMYARADIEWMAGISNEHIQYFFLLHINMLPMFVIALPLIFFMIPSQINIKSIYQNKWYAILQSLIIIPLFISVPGMSTVLFLPNLTEGWHIAAVWGVFLLSMSLYILLSIRIINRCSEVNV